MPEWKVAAQDDAAPEPGQSTVLEFNNEPVAVHNVDGKLYAVSQRCPHAGGPLSEGFTQGSEVVCPWHGWRFCMDPDRVHEPDGVYRYHVRVHEGHLELSAQD